MSKNPFVDIEPMCERLNEAKVAAKHKTLLADASSLLQMLNTTHHGTVQELEHALSQCEDMKNSLRDTNVSREAYESLQGRVDELKCVMDVDDERTWSSFPVIFAATTAFIAGVIVTIVVLPVLRSI